MRVRQNQNRAQLLYNKHVVNKTISNLFERVMMLIVMTPFAGAITKQKLSLKLKQTPFQNKNKKKHLRNEVLFCCRGSLKFLK